ncbi:hypothetical protein POX_a00993 [Penicillium oxalicum]|uniref:hypothetical protein n=1 Tax=Penicillium oxalicum TaxID=69781 RepID=UPI0020B8970C|nr:hypothetical protein POX_a00993 [Penicillium oxalicum]KAI2794394.1 hypothetical protein POX_a00993 [Penicillium oxalicum]
MQDSERCSAVEATSSNKKDLEEAEDSLNSRKRRSSECDTAHAEQPPSPRHGGRVRQKITRACDSCKSKKTKCTGTLPGLPPEPIAATPDSTNQGSAGARLSTSMTRAPGALSTKVIAKETPTRSLPDGSQIERNDTRGESMRNSPELGSTDFEGNYIGPSSGISFIKRVWERLHQDETTQIPYECREDNNLVTTPFTMGDRPYPGHSETTFRLPLYTVAMELLKVYFDFSMVTYRFLHYQSVQQWIKQIYENQISASNLPVAVMTTRTAIVLMIFAVSNLHTESSPSGEPCQSERWFSAAKYFMTLELGPPCLETIQVRFGTTPKIPGKRVRNTESPLVMEMRKRVFWSVYTLDKYLSIMFGRPRLLHDEEIDQELPCAMGVLEESPPGTTGDMMVASVLHFRLGRVLGEISRQLYSIRPESRDGLLRKIPRLTSELEQWRDSVPSLYKSKPCSNATTPLCRQSQVLRLAYDHAMIHVTRSFLLIDIFDSNQSRKSCLIIEDHVEKCMSAAEDVMHLVSDLAQQRVFIQSFWFTHYVTFCAILVVYIYIIQRHRKFENATAPSTAGKDTETEKLRSLSILAESSQHYLAKATSRNCPSRRYSAILSELRKEVQRTLDPDGQIEDGSMPYGSGDRPHVDTLLERGLSAHESCHGQVRNRKSEETLHQSAANFSSTSDINHGTTLLEELESSTWWSQIDSWALSNFQDDLSLFDL